MRSLNVRIGRLLLLPLLLFAAVVQVRVAAAVDGEGGGGDCTGKACPCVYTGGPEGYDRICPM